MNEPILRVWQNKHNQQLLSSSKTQINFKNQNQKPWLSEVFSLINIDI